MSRVFRTRVLALRLLVLLLAPSAALLGQRAQDEPPIFRTGVQYIEVDVLVTGGRGNAVRDLTRDDFTLLEDGKSQQIDTFSFIDLPIEPAASRKAAVTAVASDVATNTAQGRMYVMLLDGFGRNLLRSRLVARQFVEEAVGADDHVAIIDVLGNMSAAQGFTNSRERMLAAIDRILGAADGDVSDVGPGADDSAGVVNGFAGDPVLISFRVIEEMSERLGLINGRRKVILWFDPPSVFQVLDPRLSSRMFAQRDAIRAATRNNVAFYVVSTRGLTTALGNLASKAGLRVLAEDTAGDIIVDSNNFAGGFQRFVRDSSTYYLLGYTPAVEHRDGEFHDIRVRVNRRGVRVRARRGYYAPEPDPAPGTPPPTVPAAGISPDTTAALRMPSSTGELAIELFATPFKGAGRDGSVVLGAQLRGADLVLGDGERLEVAHQAMTPAGETAPGSFHVLRLDVAPASRAAILESRVRILDRVNLPRGRHQVRFAVHQPNGKTGSVVADVEIPDFTRMPLTLSGILLASEQTAAQRTLLADVRAKTMLGSDPTVRRRFARGDTVTAFAEVYVNGEVNADEVQVTGTLSVGTETVRTVPAMRVTTEADRTGYTVTLPIEGLAPGDYVLTVEARTGTHMQQRQLPLEVE